MSDLTKRRNVLLVDDDPDLAEMYRCSNAMDSR